MIYNSNRNEYRNNMASILSIIEIRSTKNKNLNFKFKRLHFELQESRKKNETLNDTIGSQ